MSGRRGWRFKGENSQHQLYPTAAPGQRHPEQLPRENHRGVGGWPVTVVRSSDQPGSHPTLQRRTGLTAGFLVSMDSRQAPNVSFV